MDLPTVLGRVVLVDGCTVFPSVQALAELDFDGSRPQELQNVLDAIYAYEREVLELRAATVRQMRFLRWPWKKIGRRFGELPECAHRLLRTSPFGERSQRRLNAS